MGPIGRVPGAPRAPATHDGEPLLAARESRGLIVPFGGGDGSRFLGNDAVAHRVSLREPQRADVPDAVNVSTGRFGIITRETPAQVIQTAGAGPCVIVVLHDATSGVAALAHFFPNQDLGRSLAAMVRTARQAGLDPRRAVAHVAGGLDAAPELPERALAALASYGFAPGERDLLGVEVRNVQFHLRSGRIERYHERENDRPPAPHDAPVAALQRHPRAWRP